MTPSFGGIDPGLVLVHNHPGATWEGQLEPSDDDLDTGGRLLLQGIGTALVSNDLGSFVMLYPPTPPAPHPTPRSWSLGGPRFGVTFRFPTPLRSSTR